MPDSIIPPIPITAEDKYSKVLDHFRRTALSTFRDVGGSVREVGEAGKKIGEVFEPFTKLAGVGGIAGAGLGLAGALEGLERFARSGAEIGRTAQRIDVVPRILQETGHAAYLAGANFDSGAIALESLGEKLHGAAWGRDQEAIAVFKEFGIAVRDANGQVRKADDVLPQVADRIKSLRDPYQQAALATALLGSAGRDLLPYLRDGAEGLARYREEVKKHGAAISDQGLKAAKEFEEAQRSLELSAKGMGNAIAEHYLPMLTPAITKTTEWLDEIRKSPAALSAVEVGAGLLATVLGGTLLSSVSRLVLVLAKMNPALFVIGGIMSLIEAGRGLGLITGEGGAQWDPAWGPRPPGWTGPKSEDQPPDTIDRLLNPVRRFFGLKTKTSGGIPTPSAGGAAGIGHVAAQAERIDFIRQYARSKGLNPDAVLATVAGEGLKRYVGDKGTSFGDFQLHVGGGMGDAAVAAGIDIRNPATWKQQAMFAMDRMAEHRGEAAWYAGQWHGAPSWAAAQFSAGAAAAADTRAPGGRGGLPPWQKYNSRGEPYSDSLNTMSAQEKQNVAASMDWIYSHRGQPGAWGRPGGNENAASGPRYLPDVPDYSGALDSEHHLLVDVTGLPQGGRAQMLEGSGPAKVTLRVQRAMSGP